MWIVPELLQVPSGCRPAPASARIVPRLTKLLRERVFAVPLGANPEVRMVPWLTTVAMSVPIDAVPPRKVMPGPMVTVAPEYWGGESELWVEDGPTRVVR